MKFLLRFFRGLFRGPQPAIIIPVRSQGALTHLERIEMREWLKLPLTQKALACMEARHPGTNLTFPAYARNEWDAHAAVSFLSRVKGWEMYRNQLLALAEPPGEARDPSETYPSNEA